MTDPTTGKVEDLALSFSAHVRDFHAALPAAEQALLEQIFALAEAATAGDDAAGYISDSLLKLKLLKSRQPPGLEPGSLGHALNLALDLGSHPFKIKLANVISGI